MEKHSGTQLNPQILALIDEQNNALFNEGRLAAAASTPPATVIVRDRVGNEHTILKEKEPLFNALNTLINELTFPEINDDEIYDIPGLKINGTKKRLYIPVSKIEAIARIIDADFGSDKKFEELTGIQLPQQVHQYREDRKGKIGDLTITAPSPKKKSETVEQYEERLKTHYAGTYEAPTTEVVVDETPRQLRGPYPHEQVDYRNGTDIDHDNISSEYYHTYENTVRRTTRPSVRPEPGERLVVEESELASEKIPFLKKVQAKATLVGNAIFTAKFWKGVALAGVTFASLKWVIVPALATPYGPGILFLGGIGVFTAACTRYFRRVKWKRDAEKERRAAEAEEEPEVEPSEEDFFTDEEDDELRATRAEIEAGLRGMSSTLEADSTLLSNLEDRLRRIDEQLRDATLPDDVKTALQEEATNLRTQKREVLIRIQENVTSYYEQFNIGRAR